MQKLRNGPRLPEPCLAARTQSRQMAGTQEEERGHVAGEALHGLWKDTNHVSTGAGQGLSTSEAGSKCSRRVAPELGVGLLPLLPKIGKRSPDKSLPLHRIVNHPKTNCSLPLKTVAAPGKKPPHFSEHTLTPATNRRKVMKQPGEKPRAVHQRQQSATRDLTRASTRCHSRAGSLRACH